MQFSPDFFDVEFSAVVVVVAQVPLAQLDGELSWKKPEKEFCFIYQHYLEMFSSVFISRV